MSTRIEICPHSAEWARQYEAEAQTLAALCAPIPVRIHHVGSTAVANLSAKPIIDILVGVAEWSHAETIAVRLEAAGYRRGSAPQPDGEQMFLARETPVPRVHLHIAPSQSDHHRDILTFRDALRADADLAAAYEALKISLARGLKGDDYSAGKSPFVTKALKRVAAAANTDVFLKHQRAELAQADAFRIWTLLLQLIIAVVAALSVFTNDAGVQLTLALIAGLVVVGWLIAARLSRRHRSAGDRARRIVLLSSGLGDTPSDAGVLMETFSAKTDNLPSLSIGAYFDTRTAPGLRRLAEMIDESAFYTGHLQRRSGELMSLALFVLLMASAGLWIVAAQCMDVDAMVMTARVFLAFLVFLFSSDMLGGAIAHFETARAMTEVRLRLNAASGRGHPQADMTLILTDYNSAVESAPMILPKLYAAEEKRLNDQWAAYLAVERQRTTTS